MQLEVVKKFGFRNTTITVRKIANRRNKLKIQLINNTIIMLITVGGSDKKLL